MDLYNGFDSNYRYILVAARRARQLQSGAKPLLQTPSKRSTRVAQMEVGAGLVPIEMISLTNGEKSQKKKAAK